MHLYTLFLWIHISNERASRIPFQTYVIRDQTGISIHTICGWNECG
uniref:Uncharacterized protein n=1 Tax=Aegilops tauschii subsp. strangulata TaxID=200361 RepID=A0A453JK16_AEGTS